jgi:CRP-like cAMP-binding protein
VLQPSDQQTHEESIWLKLFSDQPDVHVPRFSTLFSETDRALFVYVIVKGAVIELKGDRSHEGHLVSLCKHGDVFGIRVSSTNEATHSVRAMALTNTVVRIMSRERFMQLVMQSPDLFIALSVCLSKRQHFAQTLEDSCSGSSLRDHVEYVLSAVAAVYGMDRDHAAIAIPEPLLVEMVGCPQPLLDAYLQRLIVDGTVDVDVEGVRLRAV